MGGLGDWVGAKPKATEPYTAEPGRVEFGAAGPSTRILRIEKATLVRDMLLASLFSSLSFREPMDFDNVNVEIE